jgi:hypothetical protein
MIKKIWMLRILTVCLPWFSSGGGRRSQQPSATLERPQRALRLLVAPTRVGLKPD